MAPSSLILLVPVLMSMCAVPFVAHAGDPDILTDFLVPSGTNASLVQGDFFAYSSLIPSDADPTKLTVSKATGGEFPALLGQSVSYANLIFGPGTVNPPHIHPRASELLFVMEGTLFVGLINAANISDSKVYTQTLQAGDMFVFPKGMVHFQLNNGTGEVRAFSAFGSASPGTVSLPGTLFETGIDDAVLEKSFRTDQATVDELKQDLAPPPPPPSNSGAALPSRSALTLLCFGAAFFALL